MVRVHRVRWIAIWAVLLCSTPVFASPFISSQSGNWNLSSTWGGAGVPGIGDDVTIMSNHVVTVTDPRIALSVTLDGSAGNKMLVIDGGGSLLVERALPPAISINAPSPGSTNIIRMNGGQLETNNAGISITGGTTVSKLEFTSLGGVAKFEGDVAFSGTAANALIDFGPTGGTVEIGGDLGNGGTIVNNSTSLVEFDGSGAQTISGYTFNHVTVNKTGGTATLNGPITVNGNLAVLAGVLDDGGNQITLNGGGTSMVQLAGAGVLKLGSAGSATTFPTPVGTTNFSPSATVVYQAGLTQTINSAFNYEKLYLSTMGGAVNKILSGGSLTVNAQLDVWDNGASTVNLDLGTGTLDLNGNLLGDGTVSMTSGSMTIAGNFSSSATLNAGTGTVTYDGSGAQSVLGATYSNLVISKPPSVATLSGVMSAGSLAVTSGTFDLGSNTVSLTGDATISVGATLSSSSATFQLTGASPQTITTASPLTFSTLSMLNGTSADFGIADVSVNNTLNLSGGKISGNFHVDVLATVNRSLGWVRGTLEMGMNPTPARRFHVGTPTSYIPVDVDAGSAGTVTIRANDGKSPDRTYNNVLNAYWSITSGTVTPIDSITFNYNQSDFADGDETKYILASYDSGSFTFTHYGDVDDVNNNVMQNTLTGYIQDWMIGQPGSMAAASQLAIVSVNSGSDPAAGSPFDVVVESRDDGGTLTPVFDPTGISLSVAIGTGTLGGTTTGTINGGSDTATISGVTYSPAENNVALTVSRTFGDDLTPDNSSTFNVTAASSTFTVSSLADSGANTLRDAIANANTGVCPSPCTIEFSVAGTINLATALAPIVANDLTIDGFTAPGAMANANAFGSPANSILTIAIDGTAGVATGLEVQGTGVKIKGLAIKNFFNGGSGMGVKFSGTNTGSVLSGCYVGTDISGTAAASNAYGVYLGGATGVTVGGTAPADRNLISGNSLFGVKTDLASASITVLGNYIGTNRALTSPIANNGGIYVCSACDVNVGTNAVGNVVSGNTLQGILLAGSNTDVKGNIVGPAGNNSVLSLPNGLGIQIDAGSNFNTVGGLVASERNVVSGNTTNGMLIRGDDNVIDGNYFGIAPDGTTAMANGNSGLRLEVAAARNLIGVNAPNKFAFNTNDGVTIATTTGIGNVVRTNKIAGNLNRAIDIDDDGTTANDGTDSDTGANNRQNFPTITEAKYNAGNVNLKLSLNSSGGVNANFFRFDVYKADGSIPAQALEFLGNSGCMAGNVFTNLLVNVSAGTTVVSNSIVATATAYSDAACNTPSEGTSELSASLRVSGPVHWITGNGNWGTAANWSPAIVPASTDDAYIDNTGTYTVTVNVLTNVASVQVGAAGGIQTLDIAASQSLNLNSGTSSVSSNGNLALSGIGIGVGGGALTIAGKFDWNIGSITGAGGITMASGSTLNIATTSGKTINAGSLTIGNGATANWLNGPINMASGATIDNFGLFEIKTDQTIADAGGAGTVDNAGTFRKSTTVGQTLFSNLVFNHTGGSLDIQTGTLNLSGGAASAPISISSGATLLIDDVTFTLNAGADTTGGGKIYINGGTLAVDGSPVLIEHLQLDLGTLGGIGTAKTGATGVWQWNGGTMGGTAATSLIETGGSLTISGVATKTLSNRSLTTQGGTTTLINGSGNINMGSGGAINNAGLINDASDLTFNDTGSDGGILNSGTFQKSGGVLTLFNNVDFTNSGTLTVMAGTLNPGNITNTGGIGLSSGTLFLDDSIVTLNAGSDVSGAGMLQVAGGTLTVNTSDVLPKVQLDSGTLNGTATFDITAFFWNGGTMSGSGTTNTPNGAAATIGNTGTKNLVRTYSVASGGTATVNGTGTINLFSGGNIANAGLFDFAVDVLVNDSGSDGGFLNSNILRKSGGAGSLTFNNVDITNNATIDIQQGTFNPVNVTSLGPITLSGTSVFFVDDGIVTLNTGTDISGTGQLNIFNGTVTANTADTIPNLKFDAGTLNGSAVINVTNLQWSGGTMSGVGTTTIPTGATATIETNTAKNLQRTFTIQNGAATNVTGTGTINMGTGSNINNDGTLEVTAAMTFNDSGGGGDITNTRTFRSNHAGTTTLSVITLNSNGGAAVIDVPLGTLDLADGTSNAQISIGSVGTVLVNSDTYTLASGATVLGAGTLSLTGGTLNVTGNVSVPQFSQNGGTVDGTGTLTFSNTATWQTGTMQGGGTTTVGSGAFLNLTTPSAKALNNRTLSTVAGGTINLSGNGPVNMSNGANIANAGLLLITADNTFNDSVAAGNIVNTGTIRKQSATGPTTITNIGLTNNGGLIDIQSGTISMTGDPFTQAAGSTLKVWLNGTTPGSGFGQLSSNAVVNLAGTLEVALVGLYQPASGDTFRVIAAPGHSGDFTHPYTYPVLAGSRTFSDAFDGSGLLLTVIGNADLSITKNAPSNVIVGAPIAYTLNVSNAGPDAASSVSVTDVLETGHTSISANGSGWSCNVVSLTVTCTMATLNTGAAPAITINANAPASPTTFTNVANVTATTSDGNAGNNSGSAIVTVDPNQADVEVTVTTPGTPQPQSTAFTFTFHVKNNGPQIASSVTFSAPIPAGLSYNSAIPSQGSCNFSAGTVTCGLSNIGSGNTVNVAISLNTTTTAGTHIVTGTASATEPDPNGANNSANATVEVTGGTITVINTNDSGPGSLREALNDAGNGVCTPLPCTINFNIPSGPFVIAPPTVELPIVQNQTIIDGTTQPGYAGTPIVRIDGGGNLTYAFKIDGDNSKVKGLSLTGFNYGVDIHGDSNTVEACYVGLDPAGNASPNDDGIRLVGDSNTIGGNSPAQRNVISGNNSAGVYIESDGPGNTVSGNSIGTDPAGTAARPNTSGIVIVGEADNTTIGGPTAGHRNVISGNTDFGVYIEGSGGSFIVGTPSTNALLDGIIDDTLIRNNWIGPNAAGTAALGGITGVALGNYGANTTITDNVISGNQNGIAFDTSDVTGTKVMTNLIGIAPDSVTPMGNTIAGIVITDGTSNTVEANAIAYNGPAGIVAFDGQGNAFNQNSIHDHTGLGIDLNDDGVTANDGTDSDSGPNGLQNFPTLTTVVLTGGGNISISSNINSSGSPASIGSIRLDYFKADASGEGQTYLGFACVAGNSFGLTSMFSAPSVNAGDPIVATATSFTDSGCTTVADGTSEFSNVVIAANCTPPPVTITGPTQMCAGDPAVTLDAGAGFAQYLWSTGATTQTIAVAPGTTAAFSVTVTDNLGCTNSDSHTVTVNPIPTVTITGPTATCAGTPVTLDAGPGFASYSWNTGAISQTISVSPSSTTNYSVTVTNAGGCSATDSHLVTVSSSPTATITAPPSVCQNSTGNAASVGAVAGASYAWTIGNGTITGGAGTPAITFTAGPSGTVTLGVTITAGSCTSTGNANVPIATPPTVTITGPTSACAGTNVTLDAGAGFASYMWSNGATSQTITVASNFTTNYTVTATTAAGCSATDSHTVTITSAPTATITAPSSASPNQSGLNASVPVQPGATYAWSITNGTIDSGNGTDSIVFTAGASGLTELDVVVSLGGCSTPSNAFVFIEGTQPAGADLGVTKTAPATVQAGASLTYSIGIRNLGPDTATSVVITDALPAGTTFVSMNPGPWNCTRNGATVRCTGNAVAGANSTITISVNAPQQGGVITNTVQIASSTPDPNAANDSASASTSVQAASPTCTSTPPALLLPVNLASVNSPVTFSWSPVSGASEYELWIDNSLAAVTTSTSSAQPLSAGTFRWFVVVRFSNGCDPLSSETRIVTVLETGGCANASPELRSPANGSTVSSPTTFMWTPVAQAIGYRLWVEANGTAAQDVGTTNGATSLSVSLPPGPVIAYVDALFSGCRPARSAPVALSVVRPDPCASRTTATPVAPANNSVVNGSSVEFFWNEAAGSDGYRVWYSVDGSAFAVLGVTSTNETSLRATIGRGTVVWFVETLHDGCASTESQNFRFTIPARNDCTQQAPSTLAPANNATVTNGNVLFAWTAVPGAVSYELWVAANDGTPILFGTTTGTTLTRIVPAGEIAWFVRAIVDRCGPRDSQRSRFTYTPSAACANGERPALVTPLPDAAVNTPVRFAWTDAGATKYELYLIRGNGAPLLAASTTSTEVGNVNVAPGQVRWFVRAYFNDCSPLDSEERALQIVPAAPPCSPMAAPVVSAPGQISSGIPFLIQWTPVSGATAYQVLIAENADFANASISTLTATEMVYQSTNAGTAAMLRWVRVRAIDARCQPASVSPYGPAHVLVILPKTGNVGSAPLGSGNVVLEIELGPQYAGQSFHATPKQPWLSVTPASGGVAAGGTKLTVTANTGDLPVGTSVGSISVSFGSAAAGIATNDGVIGLPLSVSLVTPITPSPSNTPPPDALIIPAVAHADGINSHFQSDVRVSNTSGQLVTYQVTFTPSGDSGITQGQQSTFSIEPGQTIALDDILKSWFGTSGNSAIGTLEIRPLTQTTTSTQGTAFTGLANLTSFASSRTFNVTSNGTFGQYIPAIPFANFIGSQRILSLQQIAQSSRYRTNLGVLEGSGEPASLIVRMFGEGGQSLGQFPLSLNGGQHMQLNAFLRDHGVDNLTDGRVEVEVVSEGGKITAYASVLDNLTSDPLLVTPVPIDAAGATKWVVPGVADLVSGFANWQTDMRLFNAGTEDVEATLSFYSQNGGAPKVKTLTIPAGKVQQFDRTLATLFETSNDGGAVHITTANAARLIATARTYNQVGNGTYGQFISAVTPNEAAGVESRPLQLLQVEETDRFRSNVGLVEVTGNPVRLEITAIPPDAKFTAVTELFLSGNEFRQLGSLLKSMGLGDTHNARVTVKVLDGTGRVTAYASVIDMLTNDPTYVPAQ